MHKELIEREAERYAKEIWADHYINVLPESVIEKGRKGYADAAIHGANFALEMERWVKVEDGCEMPTMDKRVLVVSENGVTHATYDTYGCFFCMGQLLQNVTHWQPLPNLPK